MLCGDLKTMQPDFMGGFITAHSPDAMVSVAIPIPVINEEIFENLKVLDEQIELPVVDIFDRLPIETTTYGEVWQLEDMQIRFDEKVCDTCSDRRSCPIAEICPSGSFDPNRGIDPKSCYACGACRCLCTEQNFSEDYGAISVKGKRVPITLRQSCRSKAERIAEVLKKMLIDRSFSLVEPSAPLHPSQE